MNIVIPYITLSARKPIDIDYSALTEGIETNSTTPLFKVGGRIRRTKYKNSFS